MSGKYTRSMKQSLHSYLPAKGPVPMLPLIFDVLIMFILSGMNVEETNAKIEKEKEMSL